MVFLGKLIPFREEYSLYFNLEKFIDYGITIIFLLYGLKLNIKDVVKDITNWRMHLVVQLGTFVLFPFLVLLFYYFVKNTSYFPVWLSIYFLACLPSTVSSSVVMVSVAKGNVTSAIFNASISGLIGIVMTPLLMSFFVNSSPAETGNEEKTIINQLLLMVLLPILIGLILNPIFKKWIIKYSKWIAEFDRLIILLIVYESFSKAFISNVFSSVSLIVFVILIFGSIVLFFAVYYILKWISQKLNFNRKDAITVTFCGSKKSLVHGSMFIMVLGIAEDQKVLFLLPVMLYHSFQLFYVSWLANKIAMKK